MPVAFLAGIYLYLPKENIETDRYLIIHSFGDNCFTVRQLDEGTQTEEFVYLMSNHNPIEAFPGDTLIEFRTYKKNLFDIILERSKAPIKIEHEVRWGKETQFEFKFRFS